MTAAALGRLLGCRRGTAAIEFAIIASVLVTLMVGGVDFGRTLYIKNQLSFLADKAARAVLISPGISDATLTADLKADFAAGDPAGLTVTVAAETIGTDSFRVLTVSYPVTLFVPGLDSNALTLDIRRRIPTG